MIRSNRHSKYDLEYHLVVVTRYRHPVLNNEVTQRLIEISHRLFKNDWNCIISEINTSADHIHILFEAPPQVQLSKLVNNFKTVTSRLIRKEFSGYLKPYYWKPYFWSMSYYIATVSERTHDSVVNYIMLQDKDDPNPT